MNPMLNITETSLCNFLLNMTSISIWSAWPLVCSIVKAFHFIKLIHFVGIILCKGTSTFP